MDQFAVISISYRSTKQMHTIKYSYASSIDTVYSICLRIQKSSTTLGYQPVRSLKTSPGLSCVDSLRNDAGMPGSRYCCPSLLSAGLWSAMNKGHVCRLRFFRWIVRAHRSPSSIPSEGSDDPLGSAPSKLLLTTRMSGGPEFLELLEEHKNILHQKRMHRSIENGPHDARGTKTYNLCFGVI